MEFMIVMIWEIFYFWYIYLLVFLWVDVICVVKIERNFFGELWVEVFCFLLEFWEWINFWKFWVELSVLFWGVLLNLFEFWNCSRFWLDFFLLFSFIWDKSELILLGIFVLLKGVKLFFEKFLYIVLLCGLGNEDKSFLFLFELYLYEIEVFLVFCKVFCVLIFLL